MGLDGNGQETVPLKGTDWGFGIVDAHSAVAIAREGTGDTTLNSALAAPMPAKHSKGREWVTEDLNGDRFEEVLIDFTVASADAVSGVPLAISVSSPLSGFLTTIPNCPPILCGYRYVPDIDIFLYRRANGNNYTQIASSICPAAAYNGECGPNGVHESIRIANPAADDYRLGIVFLNDEIDSSASNALVKYDITWGATTTTPTAPVANLAPIPEPIADFTSNLTSVSLDASASSDPDGSIAFYAWYSASDTEAGTSPQATLELPNGQTTVVTLTVTDNLGKSASHDIAVTVATGGPVNQAPTAGPQNVSTDEDTALPITLTGSDPEGDPLTFTLVAQPANGSLSGTLPDVVYTLDQDFNGADSFTFKVNDGQLDSDPATVEIDVVAVDDPPTADPQSVATSVNTALAITLTGGDPDGTSPTLAVATGPANGSLSGTAPNLTYTPNLDFDGVDSFTFTANDGTTTSAPATVDITFTPLNQAPVADAGPNQEVQSSGRGPSAGATITLDGAASSDDGTITQYAWSWSGGGVTTTDPSVNVFLGKGVYDIALTVTDDGAPGLTNADTVCIDVYNKKPSGTCASSGGNGAPTAVIDGGSQTVADSDGVAGESVTLNGGNSTDDGTITSHQWSWSGGSASGPSLTTTLPDGATAVTLTVTDDQGLTDQTTATITVQAPGSGGALSVGSITFSVRGRGLTGTVTVDPPVSGVTVNASFCGPVGCTFDHVDEVTNNNGQASYKIVGFSAGFTYTLTVHSLTQNGTVCDTGACSSSANYVP